MSDSKKFLLGPCSDISISTTASKVALCYMATSMSPGEDAQLRKANKKISDLLEDVRRLSAELRDKDALLARSMEVAHEQSLRIASLSAAFQDTAPWDPSCPRPSSCSTPNRQRSWTEVVIRGRRRTPVKAGSPPLSLSNLFLALSQLEEKPADGECLSSAPAVFSTSCPNGPAASPPLLDTVRPLHSTGSASPPVAVPVQQLSSRASTSASRWKLLEEAARRRSGSHRCPGEIPDPRPGDEAATCHNGHHHLEPTKLPSARSGTIRVTGTTGSPPAERPASALRRRDTRPATAPAQAPAPAPTPAPAPAPAPLPGCRPKMTARRSQAPDSGVASSPHRSPPPLFRPTTLIIGDSIVKNIRYFNAITRCFPGATAAVILDKLPELLRSIPSSIRRVIVHVGTNDTFHRQSEVTKIDFLNLFSLLESCGKSVFINGPIPTLSRGAERFSRILSLSTWLQHTCPAHNLSFIDNFNLFWNRSGFYRHDGLHPSTLGSSFLTANILHVVQSSPAE